MWIARNNYGHELSFAKNPAYYHRLRVGCSWQSNGSVRDFCREKSSMNENDYNAEEVIRDIGSSIFLQNITLSDLVKKYGKSIHIAREKCPYLFTEHLESIRIIEKTSPIEETGLFILFFAMGTNFDLWKHAEYLAYLRSSTWREIAQRIKEKYGNKCAICNRTGALNVHHRTYENIFREQDEDLICLCNKCHSKFHNKDQ
jgi:hypothetical protein